MMEENQPAPGVEGEMVARFFESLSSAHSALLMLDYDGTLAPFHTDPSRAKLYPGVEEKLGRILRSGKTRLILVTGRALDDFLSLFSLEPLPEIWASHGRERRTIDGQVARFPAAHPQADGLAAALEKSSAFTPPARIEQKPYSLACHVRGLLKPAQKEVLAQARRLWAPISAGANLELMEFDGGIEIRAAGRGKGDVVETIWRESPPGTVAAYLGDDRTDEDAFRCLEEKGLTVRVSEAPRPTLAQVWLRPPEELLRFLDMWKEALGD